MNICKSCKHFMPDKTFRDPKYAIKYGVCRHPLFQTIDKVSGEVTYEKAKILREYPSSVSNLTCGPEGEYYEEESGIIMLQKEFMVPLILEPILYFVTIFIVVSLLVS